jgi:hypothetical protein
VRVTASISSRMTFVDSVIACSETERRGMNLYPHGMCVRVLLPGVERSVKDRNQNAR